VDRRNKCAPPLGRSAGRRPELAGDAGRPAAAGLLLHRPRQAMPRDDRDPAGIYFGTNSGSVFGSVDDPGGGGGGAGVTC